MQYTRATVAGVLNANASTDSEARSHVSRLFGIALGLILLLDVGCAFLGVWLSCRREEGEDGGGEGNCVRNAITKGVSVRPVPRAGEEDVGVGDLFVLAVIRCVVTCVLLGVGVRYGRHTNASSSQQRPLSQTINNNEEEHSLTTPLLASNGSTDDTTDNGGGDGDGNRSRTTTTDSMTTVALEAQSNRTMSPTNQDNDTTTAANDDDDNNGTKGPILTPERAQNTCLLFLFLLSTFYQIYAGLKVATYPLPPPPSSDNNHHNNDQLLLTILMCLSVLWINAGAYLFRTLLSEMTREDAIFLDSKIHRHPVFYQDDRGLAMHWCDLCQQRIGNGTNTTATSTTTTATNNSDNNKPTTGVYRCSLCDFDVCTKCAHRSDAATIGENLLRSDTGVSSVPPITNDSYFRRTLTIARPELPLLTISFCLLALNSAGRIALPHLQGKIIDAVILPDSGSSSSSGGGEEEDKKMEFKYYIGVYVVLMLVQGAVSTGYSAIFTLVSRRLKFTIRNSLLEKILAQDIAYFDGTESGRLISRLTNDLELMMAPIQSSLSSLLNNVLLLIGGMIMCFTKSYRLSMLAFVTVGPITYLWELYAQWSKGLAREMLAHWAEGNSIAHQALSHVRTVKAFGCEESVIGKYTDANGRALHCGVKDAWGNGFTTALTGYLDLGSGVLILYFGGHLVYDGQMTVGELVTFQLFWNMMNNAYQGLQGLVTSFTRSAAGAEKVFSLWDSQPDIDPNVGDDIDWNAEGHLSMTNVKFYYQMRPDNIVLDGFNLDIPAGKTIALVGRSGGGKSTIIHMLLRFYDAKAGSITLDGRPYNTLKVNQLRRLFGVVTQETELFATTVEENIAFGMSPDEYTSEDVVNAAKKAFAHEFIIDMKDGYATRIGERGNRLSGGQRQRIAIARVFLRKPKVILLDEATSALDEDSQERVQRALGVLIKESGATVVLVAHRLSTVMGADSIVVIDKGVALEQGSHEELVGRGGIYASMVKKQHTKEANKLDQERRREEGGGGEDKKALDDIDSLLADQSLQS